MPSEVGGVSNCPVHPSVDRKDALIKRIAEAVTDMERHAHAHIEAQQRVVRLRAEYDEIMASERRSASGTKVR